MELKKTITTLFMVRTLGIRKESLDKMGFINGFIKDLGNDCHYENCVYLLFKPRDMDLFMDFLEGERNLRKVVDDYDYPGGYVVVVYELNKKFKADFDLVKRGLYSKTSKEFQDLFPKITKIFKNGKHRDEISLQYRIFNKTQDLINYWEEKLGVDFSPDQEVWEGFHEEREVLNLNKIKEHVEKTSN